MSVLSMKWNIQHHSIKPCMQVIRINSFSHFWEAVKRESELMKTLQRFFTLLSMLVVPLGLTAQDVVIDNIDVTPVSCSDASDGEIKVDVSGGDGNYTYTLLVGFIPVESFGPTTNTSHTFSGYPKGTTYGVGVDDGDPMTNADFSFASIGGPVPIAISNVVTTDVNCAGIDDGTLTVTAAGEDNNLLYSISGPSSPPDNSTGVFTSLSSGTYDVTVYHATCSSTDVSNNHFIDVPPALTITLDTNTPASCFGGSDGSLEITPNGGTPSGVGTGYTYLWTGPGTFSSTDEDIFGLEAGAYTVVVTDDNACTTPLGPITVGQATEITLPTVNSTDVSCNGGSDGTASISVSGGSAPYTFAWLGQGTAHSSSDQNPVTLIADTYNLTVTDAVGCVKVFPGIVVIGEPDPILAVEDLTTDVSCFGGADGSADITVSGGTLPYTFSWTAAIGPYTSSQEDPTGMPADTYSLEVSDGNGCVQNFPNLIVVNEPNDIIAILDGFTDVSCFGGNDGEAQVTVTEGTPGYSYLWTGDLTAHTSTAEDPTDLIKDTYDLQITDANSCVKNFNDIVVIDQPADISILPVSITHVDCNGEATGEISITPTGGTGPYIFAWTGPNSFTSSDEDITGLEAGSYDLTITDAQGCVKDFLNNVVNENTSITASFILSDLSCNSAGDGAIDATIGGGTPAYTFSWSGDNGYSNTVDEDISGLDAANYTLTVTDALGCIQAFPAQPITEPAPLTATFVKTDVTCFGADDGTINVTAAGGTMPYSYSWSGPGTFSSTAEDISGLEPGAYSLDLSDDNGCFIAYPDAVTIIEPSDISVAATTTDITCNGAGDGTISIVTSGGTPAYSFAWTGPGTFSSTDQNISSLESGSYNLTVTDNNSCIKIFPAIESIAEPPAIIVTFTGKTDLLCNGASTGEITIDVAGGVLPLSFEWTNSLGAVLSTDEDPTGLPAGVYSLKVVDANSCEVNYTDAVTLDEPPALTLSLTKTDVVCAGESTGSIVATASGGTPGYLYSQFSGGPYGPGNTFSGLSSGSYTIYAEDANGCRTNATENITSPMVIDYNVSTLGTNLCSYDSSVTISISNVIGGVPPYEYSIDGGSNYQSTGDFPNQPGGDYPLVVRDANFCEKSPTFPLTVFSPPEIKITFYDYDDITSCYDALEGRIAIQGNGGTGSIEYALDGGVPVTPGEFLNIPGGFHTVSLVDDNSCQKDTIVELLRPVKLIFDFATITDVSGCTGDNNGQIDVSASGGTGVISYEIDGGGFGGSGTFGSLLAGTYLVSAKDANDCQIDTTLTIGEPSPISFDTETATPASCNGLADGSVTVSASGGTPGYTYTLNPAALPPNTTGIFSGLPAGDYTVDVTDTPGCGPFTSGILTVSEPPALLLDSISVEFISCNGANDGKIDIYVIGGTGPYEYSIDNEASYLTTSSFTGLGPGSYDVYARDANGCKLFIDTYILAEPTPLTLAPPTVTDITPCFGGSNGAISTTASGGWLEYEYSIDGLNFQPTGDFSGLSAGDYTVFVRDTGNCTSSIPATVNEPDEVTATVAKTDYVDEVLGTISISDASGGTPPYEYSIDGLAGTFTSTTDYTDLVAGPYDVVVRDANGCTYEESIIIFDIIPLSMVINATDVTCFGLDDGTIEFDPQDAVGTVQYSIDDGASYVTNPLFENLPGDSTYILRAFDDDGKQYLDSVTIAEPDELFIYKSITPANCNAFSETGSIDITLAGGTGASTFLWSNGESTEDLNTIVSGWYTITATDEAGCEVDDSIFVPALVIVDAYAGEDTTVCSGSTILLDALPGDIMLWEPSTYLSNQGVSNPVALDITDSISYVFTVTETTSGLGCYNTDTLNIGVLPVYGISLPADTVGLEGQQVQLDVETEGTFVSYEWIPASGLDMSDVANPIVTLQTTTNYVILATNDFGCVESDTILVEVVEDLTVYNVFSPNGDFINDFFEIENAAAFPDILVEVYNRWGSKVFSTVGYSDDKRWDGTSNGKDVPIGTYYYVIIPYSDATPVTGNVTIIR